MGVYERVLLSTVCAPVVFRRHDVVGDGTTPKGCVVERQGVSPVSRAIRTRAAETLVAGETVGRVVNRDDQSRRAARMATMWDRLRGGKR